MRKVFYIGTKGKNYALVWYSLVVNIISTSSLSSDRPLLAPQHFLPLLNSKGVRDWWGVALYWLGVPDSKRQEIREQYDSDEDKAVH